MTEREPWLGHRDLCELQWGQPCECDNGPEYLAEAGLTNEPEGEPTYDHVCPRREAVHSPAHP